MVTQPGQGQSLQAQLATLKKYNEYEEKKFKIYIETSRAEIQRCRLLSRQQ